jgi:hypothetical protein
MSTEKISIVVLLFLLIAGCKPMQKITCSNNEQYSVTSKENQKTLKNVEFYSTKLNQSLKQLNGLNPKQIEKVDSLSFFLNQYKDSSKAKIENAYLVYANSPCRQESQNDYFITIKTVSYRNKSISMFQKKLDSSQGQILNNFQNITDLYFYLLKPPPPEFNDFPAGNDYELKNSDNFEKILLDDLNKYHFHYETITKDGFTFTKTDYSNLKIPNYKNTGLIALLISRVYQTGKLFKYRVQYISKKQYSALDNLQDPDRVIESFSQSFLDTIETDLSK